MYAIWKTTNTNKTITITYNKNGGTGTMSSSTGTAVFNGTTCVTKASIKLRTNTFTRSGYTFKGWATTSSANSATYTDGGTYQFSANTTLYAVWEEDYDIGADTITNLKHNYWQASAGFNYCIFRIKLTVNKTSTSCARTLYCDVCDGPACNHEFYSLTRG